MQFDTFPSKEIGVENEPCMDSKVTVRNCWYYLSLLERFVQATEKMSQETLQIYLVRAEYRYIKWISNYDPTKNNEEMVPPVDIAFFWQAHMLSPLRYFEDEYAVRKSGSGTSSIPLELIHNHKHHGSAVHYTYKEWKHITDPNIPGHKIRKQWHRHMGKKEPYHLTEGLISADTTDTALLDCVHCKKQINLVWRSYASWRTDEKNAIECAYCSTLFTIKHVGKVNLENAIPNYAFSGLYLRKDGQEIPDYKCMEIAIQHLRMKEIPFDLGLQAIDDQMQTKMEHLPDKKEAELSRKKIINAIKSTYMCTPYSRSSMDLIMAVARQYKFARQVTRKIRWNLPTDLVRGIKKYHEFLKLIQENPLLVAVPTLEIDVVWHTHMLHHSHYVKFTRHCFGHILNHDDTIPEDALKEHLEKTNRAWESQSSEPLQRRPSWVQTVVGQIKSKANFSTQSKEQKKSRAQTKAMKKFLDAALTTEKNPVLVMAKNENGEDPSYHDRGKTNTTFFSGHCLSTDIRYGTRVFGHG
ncbi:hypothetical protein BY458DRAFT_130426 [Sporodiniella umbellata]|nr:hypothetical protein BY458DRAFT_130426 [Sporodiniella umbellata]